jgi:HK97 gp10 family phage protein
MPSVFDKGANRFRDVTTGRFVAAGTGTTDKPAAAATEKSSRGGQKSATKGGGGSNFYPGKFTGTMIKKKSRQLRIIAVKLEADIISNFSAGNASGETPSAAFEIPRVVTGTLKRSIGRQKISRLVYRVGSSLKPQGGHPSYAWLLEIGTENMLPRPWLRPAFDRNREEMTRILSEI